MKEAGYQPPPTPRDRAMSVVHHADSTAANLGHAGAHVAAAITGGPGTASERFNLRHARGHAARALDHIQALNDRLKRIPNFATHYGPLGRAESSETHVPSRAEEAHEGRSVERRERRSGGERPERRLARGGRR